MSKSPDADGIRQARLLVCERVTHRAPQGGERLFEGELIINHSKDWQIWRYEIKTGNPHAHFKTKSAMDKFLNLIDEGIMPTSLHYFVSAKRLFSNEELLSLKEERHKERYRNNVKKLRKQRKVYKYR
jgi:hypothetical protein